MHFFVYALVSDKINKFKAYTRDVDSKPTIFNRPNFVVRGPVPGYDTMIVLLTLRC